MIMLGSLGIGFVWGWLLGLIIDRRPRPFPWQGLFTILTPLAAATSAFVYTIQALFGIINSYYFLGAAVVAALLHHAILQGLRLRYDSVSE